MLAMELCEKWCGLMVTCNDAAVVGGQAGWGVSPALTFKVLASELQQQYCTAA